MHIPTGGHEPNSNNAREAPLHLPQSIDSSLGTGTELVARVIHRVSHCSPTRSCAQIARRFPLSGWHPSYSVARKIAGPMRCNHIPATSIAKGRTIFLESLGNLSAEAQLALLRVLPETESQPTGLARWESGVSGDGGIFGNRMRKPAEVMEKKWLPCSSNTGARWANKKEANFEHLRFRPATS